MIVEPDRDMPGSNDAHWATPIQNAEVTPPTVHQMVLTLERRGFIQRIPGQARSITLIVPPESLPPLQRPQARASKQEV